MIRSGIFRRDAGMGRDTLQRNRRRCETLCRCSAVRTARYVMAMLRALARGALALLTVVAPSALAAQTPAASTTRLPVADGAPDPLHQSGKYLSIYLLTMGNGEQVWELFGHNGIWVHDNVTQRDTVLNWGVFDFRAPHFILHFLQGRMWYAMGADSLRQIFFAYQYLNRTVNAQELDLSTAQKDSIISQILWYSKPENVNYRYDYFG